MFFSASKARFINLDSASNSSETSGAFKNIDMLNK